MGVCVALLAATGSAGTFTVDDDDVRFVFHEEDGSPRELLWKGGSGNELIEQTIWVVPVGAMLQVRGAGAPGSFYEDDSVLSDVMQAPGYYHATFTSAKYGSKTLDMRWNADGLYIRADYHIEVSDAVTGWSWEPGGTNGDGNDWVRIYPAGLVPYEVNVPYPGGVSYFYDGPATAMGVRDADHDEMFGYKSDNVLTYKVGSGASLDGPFLFPPEGDVTIEFALTSVTNFVQFVAGNWRIPAPLPGDANLDGLVSGIDLALWQREYDPLGLDGEANTWGMGDWNWDDKIDGADLALWQVNYDPIGSGAVAGTAEIPEPGALLLVGTGAAAALGELRRRRMR
jgi:hypothetical protein